MPRAPSLAPSDQLCAAYRAHLAVFSSPRDKSGRLPLFLLVQRCCRVLTSQAAEHCVGGDIRLLREIRRRRVAAARELKEKIVSCNAALTPRYPVFATPHYATS